MFFGWNTKREDTLVIGVGKAEIAKADDVHTNNDIIVFEIAFHYFAIGYNITRRYQYMYQVRVRIACSTDARNPTLLIGFKLKLPDDARGNDGSGSTSVPHGIVGVKQVAIQ